MKRWFRITKPSLKLWSGRVKQPCSTIRSLDLSWPKVLCIKLMSSAILKELSMGQWSGRNKPAPFHVGGNAGRDPKPSYRWDGDRYATNVLVAQVAAFDKVGCCWLDMRCPDVCRRLL